MLWVVLGSRIIYYLRLNPLLRGFGGGNGNNRKIHWTKWDRLCDSKRDGGTGFRDLRSFNIAMLGKPIWRIIYYPNALLSRILKAKYFPNCDVLDAIPKGSSSFTEKHL